MPVIGHALVGLATGLTLSSSISSNPSAPLSRWSRDTWVFLMVVLAYTPDIAAQLLQLAGVPDVSRVTHSLGFVAVVGPIVGLALASLYGTTRRFGTATALLALGLHVTLDVLQGTDRAVLWPLTSRRLSVGVSLIPRSMSGELAFIGVALAAAGVLARKRLGPVFSSRISLVPVIGTALVLGLAVTTHAMRDRRERQLRAAKWLVEDQHLYLPALALLDQAGRWPSPAKPGRIAYLRAEAWNSLGDRARAERSYLASYAEDPSYFWTVADLALFYAAGPEPGPVRRHAAAPYIARLSGRFARHRETARTLERIEQLLRSGEQ